MPQPGLHALIARWTLERWQAEPGLAPFAPDAAGVRNAFLHGSLAPDMGFFPGSDASLSKRIHAQGSSQTARVLLGSAGTDVEAAFAWGWLTHVLADMEIHPVINAAASRAAGVAPGTDPGEAALRQAHVRTEVGLDAWWCGHTGADRMPPLRHAFDRRSIVFLQRALRFSHSLRVSPNQLLAAHRNVTFMFRAYLRLAARLAPEMATEGLQNSQLHALRLCSRLFVKRTSAAFGFLYPLVPGRELIAQVHAGLARVERGMNHYVRTGLHHLPDYDLETGAALAPRRTHGDDYEAELLAG
jgi:hypothetical protein